MAAVAPQPPPPPQPQPPPPAPAAMAHPAAGHARRSPSQSAGDATHGASAAGPAVAAHVPPPPPTSAPAPPKPAKAKAKKGAASAADPDEAHRAVLSRMAQLQSTADEGAQQNAEIDVEVKKATRDLNQMLAGMGPHQNKLDTLQRRYAELLADMKRTEREHVKNKKRSDQLQKEKDEVSKERTKERVLKEKMEKLSRELTRENKKLKDEYRELKESSSLRNDELHRKLESLVVDVQEVVLEKEPARQAELEHDRLFREKFASFLQQYEMRELQFQSALRMKELELLYERALKDALKKAQEKEASNSHQLTRQVSTFSQTENELRGQLNVYVEKFKQVEDTLNNSNDLFLTFRKEMEEMSKKTKRLEKENLNLTRKQEATNKNIFQMAEERSHSQQTIDRLTRENEKLKKLCRAMQNNGYGTANMAQPGHAHAGADEFDEGLEGETESEYEDEEYDEDDEGEYDDDTEDDALPAIEPPPRAFGPVPPPPPPPPQDVPNGTSRTPPTQPPPQADTAHVNGTQVNGQSVARH